MRHEPSDSFLPAARAGATTLDPERYRHLLEDFEMTKKQEDELMCVLWNTLFTWAKLGWGGDPLQLLFAQVAEDALLKNPGALQQIDAKNTDVSKRQERVKDAKKQ